MRRTPGAPSCWWMCSQTVPMCGAGGRRAREQRERARRRARRAVVVVDAMPAARRAQMLAQELAGLRREQADVEIVPLHLDALADPAGRRAVIRAPRLRRSHRDGPCARRSGSSETVRAGAGRAPAAPRQTSRRPGASSCRGCACRPSASPSDPDTPAPPRASRSAGPAAASSARGRRRLRLCLCDRDRRRGTAARRRRSARARRDRAD